MISRSLFYKAAVSTIRPLQLPSLPTDVFAPKLSTHSSKLRLDFYFQLEMLDHALRGDWVLIGRNEIEPEDVDEIESGSLEVFCLF